MKTRNENSIFKGCYYIAIILMIINYISMSYGPIHLNVTLNTIFPFLISGLFLIKLLSQKINVKYILPFYIISILAIINYIITRNSIIILLSLVIIAFEGVDIKKIIRCSLVVKIFLIIYALLQFYFFEKNNPDFIMYSYEYGYKYTMGFSHPNGAGLILFWSICEAIYLKFEKLKIRDCLAYIVIIVFFGEKTKSRTFIIMSALLFLLIFMVKILNFKSINKFLHSFSQYATIVFSIITYLAVKFYYTKNLVLKSIINIINKTLTGRLFYSVAAMRLYGITWIGRRVDYAYMFFLREFDKKSSLTIDNFYIKCLVNYGLLWLLIAIVTIYLANKKLSVKENIFFILASIYALSENMFFNIAFCFPVYFIGKLLYENLDKNIPIYKKT